MPLKAAEEKRHRKLLAGIFSHTIPLKVREIMVFKGGDSYPVCPNCGITIGREYVNFCDRCGQRLSWKRFDFADVRYIGNEK